MYGKGSKHLVLLDEDAKEAFRTLVAEMCSPLISSLSVPGRLYYIGTDASPHQTEWPSSRRIPMDEISDRILVTSTNWSRRQLQCDKKSAWRWYGQFRSYDFLFTNNMMLVLNNTPCFSYCLSTILSDASCAGQPCLSEYNYTAKYKKGRLNVVSDIVSRIPSQ